MKKRNMFGFESKKEPLLNQRDFAWRMATCFGATQLLVAFSLFVGMIGYHQLENMSWIDAFANASMILSGMGPLAPLQTWGGKLFAGFYALYSGLTLIIVAGLILAPLMHRLLHQFHLE